MNLFVNLANQFWFHSSRALYWKTVQIARVHAVQNGVPILAANNMAPSFALDADGRLLAQSVWGQRGILYVDYGSMWAASVGGGEGMQLVAREHDVSPALSSSPPLTSMANCLTFYRQ